MDYSIIKYDEYRDFVEVIGEKDYAGEFLSQIRDEFDRMKESGTPHSTLHYNKVIKANEHASTSVYSFVYLELDSRFNRIGIHPDPEDVNMPRGKGYYLQIFSHQGEGDNFRCFYIDITDEVLDLIDSYDTGFDYE